MQRKKNKGDAKGMLKSEQRNKRNQQKRKLGKGFNISKIKELGISCCQYSLNFWLIQETTIKLLEETKLNFLPQLSNRMKQGMQSDKLTKCLFSNIVQEQCSHTHTHTHKVGISESKTFTTSDFQLQLFLTHVILQLGLRLGQPQGKSETKEINFFFVYFLILSSFLYFLRPKILNNFL